MAARRDKLREVEDWHVSVLPDQLSQATAFASPEGKKTLKLCQKQDHSQIDCQALTSTDSRVLCVGAGGAVLGHLMASKLCLRLELGSTGATLVTIPGK